MAQLFLDMKQQDAAGGSDLAAQTRSAVDALTSADLAFLKILRTERRRVAVVIALLVVLGNEDPTEAMSIIREIELRSTPADAATKARDILRSLRDGPA